ncbi:GNAT family N-acetyltransferase [Nakamurella sp.]|uniref:GNAT family N-acetyltransferase n=1 Tax=Nakamurella sp. TaxID=1869182 RepID=UPI0037836824
MTAARSPTDAWSVARAAAGQASVEIRPLATLDDMTVACRLLDAVWDIPPEDASEVRPPLLRALGHAGNYLVGAHLTEGPRRGEMVAASVAFFGTPIGTSMHSHITGVLPGSGRGVGTAVKWHQRAWALDLGLSRITWTYDPLIARNSFFNLNRLGARPERYFVDFYGPMDDGPNRGQPTDRVDAIWDLRSGRTARAAARLLVGSDSSADGPVVDDLRAAGATVVLAVGADGEPEPGVAERGVTELGVAEPGVAEPGVVGPVGPEVRLIGIPADIEAIRRADPALALRWRLRLRAVLAPLLADGSHRVTGFAKAGWYVVERGKRT